MIDYCKQIFIYFTFRTFPEEEVEDDDYKEFINPMYMKR